MLPEIPVGVWDQIAVVVVFAFLLAGLGYIMTKVFAKAIADMTAMFSKAIADINSHYVTIIKDNNEQWQKYFDARAETYQLVNAKVVTQMEGLTKSIMELRADFQSHDKLEREVLDQMAEADRRRQPARKYRSE